MTFNYGVVFFEEFVDDIVDLYSFIGRNHCVVCSLLSACQDTNSPLIFTSFCPLSYIEFTLKRDNEESGAFVYTKIGQAKELSSPRSAR